MSDALPIPRRPTDVTPEWLSAAVGGDVHAVEVTPVGTGQTGATYRISATYAANPTGLPETFVIKLPTQDDAVRGGVVLGYLSEVAFYARVADKMAVPTPHCFYSDITDDGSDFALLLADMSPAEQGDQITGSTPEEARLAVVALAGLHGPSWCDPMWLELAEVAMPMPGNIDGAKGLGDIARMAVDMTLEKLGEKVPAADQETARAAMDVVTPWLMAEPDRYSLMHGDYRLDNLLFDPDRTQVTVVDWQTLGVGLPARDLSYFAATSLVPDLRAAVEQQLVDVYYQALLGYGVTGYDRETCWRDYRLGMLQAPLITCLGCAFAATTERGNEMMAVMLTRGCQAIRELQTLELTGEIAPAE
ncbi:MAG TPA: aminoglycoside phosphotransferase family protein [Mycobacterium sp.]|nr:aminoglycoside phosphotransferase family protein [Mycobacterium sp.]